MARNVKARGLGRGLDALFAEQEPVVPQETEEKKVDESGDSVVYIDIDDIKPNGKQPRKSFDPSKITELADSIAEHGIIQPLVVRKKTNGYEIVAGERRYRAAREAKLEKVPCLIRTFTDEENMLIAIIENMQREDLNPIEEAMGLNEMIKAYGMTQEQVSKSVSKSRPYITNALRLLKLPESVQKLLQEGAITTGHARALITVKDEALQQAICKKIVEEGISVREVERLAKPKEIKKVKQQAPKNADVIRVEEELKEIYGTKVSIDKKGKKGIIQLEYYNQEDLNRLIDILRTGR